MEISMTKKLRLITFQSWIRTTTDYKSRIARPGDRVNGTNMSTQRRYKSVMNVKTYPRVVNKPTRKGKNLYD